MSTSRLDGKILKQMLIGGAESIRSNMTEINDLNVFPVPDGDTGTNMTKTIEGGLSEIVSGSSESVADVISKFAHGMLLGARGNSGVILSQIFAGIKEALDKYDTVGATELAEAYKSGIDKSYAAVTNPTEGTILTVFRESVEYAAKNITSESSLEDFYRLHIEEAKRSLERTKDLLPVLAEADVVDSGGAGYLAIALGMYAALSGKVKADSYKFDSQPASSSINLDDFTRDSVLEFGYCTEFLLRLMTKKVDPDAFSVDEIIEVLESLGGESIVAYKEGDIVKVHVHTHTPGDILSACQRFGEFLTLKIENMSLGHSDVTPKKKKPKKFSVLAVATGEGISGLFTDMGADGIVSGGQTQNPSAEEFVEAFRQHEAENIIVLPNNKNVFLTAKQAAELYDAAKVHIIPTATLMEGYAALSVMTPGVTDVNALCDSLTRAAKSVAGGEVTRAVRDATVSGVDVKCGQYFAIVGGKILAVSDNREETLLGMLSEIEDMDEREIISLFVGCDVDDDSRADITERIEELYPDFEVIVYKGGQEVYDYLVAVE